jgi:hypothetical protein
MMMRAAAGCVLALATAMTGCAGLPKCSTLDTEYVIVERNAAQIAGFGPHAEVTPTPTYTALHGNFKTVALRLPDNCYQAEIHRGENQDAAQLESACGIPLQVLESSLTRQGYQVLSWSTLMGIEHEQKVPVHIAAQQIGADVVIIVNDMYVGLEKAGDEAAARYRYFASDAEGKRGRPAELFQADRDWVKKFVRDRVGNDPHADGAHSLQARLNATIVLAKGPDAKPVAAPGGPAQPPPGGSVVPGIGRSGEAIWFYNWRLGHLASTAADGSRFLFAGIPVKNYSEAFPDGPAIDESDANRHYWWPVAPLNQELAPEVRRDQATSEENFTSKYDVSPEEKALLYRQIAEDFIRRFKGG